MALFEALSTTVVAEAAVKAAEEIVENLIPAAAAEAEVLVHLLMMTALLLTAFLSAMRCFR